MKTRIYAFVLVFALLFSVPVAAEPEEIAEPGLAMAEVGEMVQQMYGRVDNSDLEVDIVWQKNEKKRVIYSGKLGGYAFGMYRYIDFTGVAYQVIFTTLGITDDVIYIVPKGDTPIEDMMDSLTADGAEANAPSGGGGLKCEVNLMYDGMYHERILIRDKVLAVPIKVTNTGSAARQTSCYIGEYAASGALLNMVDCAPIAVGANQSIATTVMHGFDEEAEYAKIFVFENGTLRPLTNAIRLTEAAADYYANSFADAQEYDIAYPIEGNIDTIGDMDYIKIVPKSSGMHTFHCISANGVLTTLYNAGQSALKANAANYQYTLTAGQTYYLKIHGGNQTGGYVLHVQRKAEASADEFDVYAFDVAANRMKTMILEQCENLYYDALDTSKAVYDDLQRLIMEDFRLHRLPDFLQNSDKNMNNYDTLVNTYLSLKSTDFSALYEKYETLLRQANEYVDGYASDDQTLANIDCPVATAPAPVFQVDENRTVIGEPSADNEMELEVITESMDADEAAADRANPSDRYLVITDKGKLGFDFRVRFPDSSPANTIYIYNFNERDGYTSWKPLWGTDRNPKLDVANGTYHVRSKDAGIVPGGIYVIAAMWADRNSDRYGGENIIYRWLQLPYDSTEGLEDFESKHVTASFEAAGINKFSTSTVTRWLGQMDQVYETLQAFTGYTPYNGRPITLLSSREDFSANQPDGENYWRLTMGWSGNPVKISQPFYQSHMKRLHNGASDWGDTPIHELSHDFDNDKWVFDHETLAFLKLAYVLEKHRATVYRIDTMRDYRGSAYADFLKVDWFEGYNESFAKGIYMPAGLASILLDIKDKIGWDAFSKTFHHIGELSWSQVPNSELGKLNLFLTCLGQYSGKDVFAMISSRDKTILAEEFGGTIAAYKPPVAEMPEGSAGRRVDISVQKGDYKQFQFVPYKTGNYRIYTSPYGDAGVPNDTYVEVYDENTETGEPIADDDDSGEGKFSRVDLQLTQGRAYYIKVYNYNKDNARLHARLHIMSNDTAVKLNLDTPQNVMTSYTEFKMFQFTPNKTGDYVFNADGYNGGQQTYETYLKLYSDEGLQTMVGQNENKIVANLAAGKTYYLQFSGYLMKYARGRITVRQGQTIEFKKRTDGSFIYVNNPEYITRYDMVDGPKNNSYPKHFGKIFEQAGVKGKNTYYQTHLAWWGLLPEIYEPEMPFYMDVDFYNPTNHDVTVSISKLAYAYGGNCVNDLKAYMEGWGLSKTLVIPAGKHWRMLGHIHPNNIGDAYVLPDGFHSAVSSGDSWRINSNNYTQIFIMFDFEVNGNDAVIVSSLAAYDKANLVMADGDIGMALGHGEIRQDGDRENEYNNGYNELIDKYKGIALQQSNQVDATLELYLDDTVQKGQNMQIRLKDADNFDSSSPLRGKWMNNINPLKDKYGARYYTTPSNLHSFEYRYDDVKKWKFAPLYKNTTFQQGTGAYVSEKSDKIAQLQNAFELHGEPAHNTPIDDTAIGMGGWGTIYHYTVTIDNAGSETRLIRLFGAGLDNTLYGLKNGNGYVVKDAQSSSKTSPADLDAWYIEPGERRVIEFITLSALGEGGQEYFFRVVE